MLLTEVREALKDRGSATLSQLSAETGIDPRFLDAALAHWEHRGRVRRHRALPSTCSPVACKSCPLVPLCGERDAAEYAEYFSWIEEDRESRPGQEPTASGSFMQSTV
jgi:hypothetical protein